VLLDEIRDEEIPGSSNTEYHEEVVEVAEFDVCTTGYYTVSFSIPFSVHATLDGDLNGACRVYLDGTDWKYVGVGRQWDGELLANGGQWCVRSGVPTNGRTEATIRLHLKRGHHILRACISSSATVVVVCLRARRRFQVWK
jgi:hypothetical protein